MRAQRGFHGRLLDGNTIALRHGHTRHDGWRSRTYEAWSSMLSRCNNPKHKAYARYGGRGIEVCARWRIFENFLADMGECPDGLTLDRFPNRDGNYEPGNCRWATYTEQARNRDVTKLTLEIANEILGRLEHGELEAHVADRFGVSRATVSDIKCGRLYRELAPFQGTRRWQPQLPKGLLTQVAMVLSEAAAPLSLKEIAIRIGKEATHASSAERLIRTLLNADMRSKGADSFFARASRGYYKLQQTFSPT